MKSDLILEHLSDLKIYIIYKTIQNILHHNPDNLIDCSDCTDFVIIVEGKYIINKLIPVPYTQKLRSSVSRFRRYQLDHL